VVQLAITATKSMMPAASDTPCYSWAIYLMCIATLVSETFRLPTDRLTLRYPFPVPKIVPGSSSLRKWIIFIPI
jgi:hypothetical protein